MENDENTKATVELLAETFREATRNASIPGAIWRNIELGRKALEYMRLLPDTLPGEYDSPSAKAELLENMLDKMSETLSPRLCIDMRRYMQTLNPGDGYNNSQLNKLLDFTDLSVSNDTYRSRHHVLLDFDPVERTPRWEEVIADVEKECERRLGKARRGMGFCFRYWTVKADVLRSFGIEWKSPGLMNPHVLFD